MVWSYLDHAAVYRQSGAAHVDVWCRRGALPLGETSARRRVRLCVVEGVGGGESVGGAVEAPKKENVHFISDLLLLPFPSFTFS